MAVAVLALVSWGCEGADEWLPKTPESSSAKKAAQSATPSDPTRSKREKLRAYYDRQTRPKEKSEAVSNDPIVQCRFAGGTEFMRRSDCSLRGGRASD